MQDVKAPRYEEDLLSWSLDQAERLRRLQKTVGDNSHGIDFKNLIDEVEGLAAYVKSILKGHIQEVIAHLDAIAYTHPEKAAAHLNTWLIDIDVFRTKIVDELDESPGLKDKLEEMCTYLWRGSTSPIILKVHETEDYTRPKRKRLRERIEQETPPKVEEVLGFEWKLHDPKSIKVLSDDYKKDPGAPRYPAFVRNALARIQSHKRKTTHFLGDLT